MDGGGFGEGGWRLRVGRLAEGGGFLEGAQPAAASRAAASCACEEAAADGCVEGGGQRLRGGLKGGERRVASVEDSRAAG